MDKDLQARQEARQLLRQAEKAQKQLAAMPPERLDRIVEAMAGAFAEEAEHLAEMAVQETHFGNVADKTRKNLFASRQVAEAVRGMKTLGILKKEDRLWQIGVPVGVLAAIVPSTNPTSTVCYKAIIAIKAGNTIVFSPHPKALCATRKATEIVAAAAERAGAPAGCISCLTLGAMSGCQELMTAPQTSLILATGGPAMVKAAYSSGKPAIGVGAGNGPAYIHSSADVPGALEKIRQSKTFDNGTVCASEQSILVESTMEDRVRREGEKLGFYFLGDQQAQALGKLLFRPSGALNPDIVGKTAIFLAEKAGFSVPADTKVLVAKEHGVGAGYPYSMEKLCPVLGFFVEENEDAALERSLEILNFEGSGHTFAIHAEDEEVIERFAKAVPVSRFLVNTPAALGGIGASTKLFPALTLGCGAVGGSASSNNISPMDLINIRRVAWDRGDSRKQPEGNEELIRMLTDKILERLG